MYVKVDDTYKNCTKCEVEYEANEENFYKVKKKDKIGDVFYILTSECKKCRIKRSKDYVIKPENWKKKLERKKQRKNRDKHNEYQRNRIAENEELRNFTKEYNRDYRRSNKDKVNAYSADANKKKHKITPKEWNSCKEYFNYCCAYCGIYEKDAKKLYGQNLHREHVIAEGRNDLKNCVPACRKCNSMKNRIPFNSWYNIKNPIFTRVRYVKIYNWLRFDVKKYIVKKKKS